jgi:putative nucleotidyltransferase with HDIG domain
VSRDSSSIYPVAFRIYLAAVVALAVVGFVLLTPRADPVAPLMLVAVLACMSLGELAAVPMPGGGYVSLGAVLDLACLVILGPVVTAWLNALSTLATQGLMKKPLVRVIHNMAIFSLTAFGAGYAYLAAGGRVGRLELPNDLGPLLVCGAVYFVLNSSLVSIAIGLTAGPNPWRIWQRDFQQGLLLHLSHLALGALLAALYVHAGPWSLPLFVIPFLVARHSFAQYREITTDLKDFVRALSEVLEEVDPYTRQHSVRVAEYSVRLARAMGCREREVEQVEYAALVHDLGKIAPQNQHILQKPGHLTHQEQRTLRGHPAVGAEIVAKVRALRAASDIVRYHHERPDGHGYPYGLLSEDVSLGAKILNVADSFDAMTSDRPYRRGRSVGEALRELDLHGGTQFDRDVVDCLIGLHRIGRWPLVPSPSSEELQLLRLRPRRVGS